MKRLPPLFMLALVLLAAWGTPPEAGKGSGRRNTVAIRKGARVDFRRIQAARILPDGSSSRSQSSVAARVSSRVQGLSLDRRISIRGPDEEFSRFRGRVRIRFDDDTTRELSLQEASRYLGFEDDGSATGVRLVARDPRVSWVKFTKDSLVSSGSETDFQRATSILDRVRASWAGTTDLSVAQRRFWKGGFRRSNRPGVGLRPAQYVLSSDRLDPASKLEQKTLQLDSKGDAILLKTPSGRRFLIDTGLTNQAADRLIREIAGETIPLNVILTHPDADHIANLRKILKTGRVEVKEILMSGWRSGTATERKLLEELRNQGYREFPLPGSSMSMYTKSAKPETKYVARLHLGADLAHYEINLEPGVRLDVFQMENPRSSNQSSLVVKVTHRGYATLYTADMDVKVMKACLGLVRMGKILDNTWLRKRLSDKSDPLNRKFEDPSKPKTPQLPAWFGRSESRPSDQKLFESEFLKWPHHAWLPGTPEQLETVRQFVRAVDPKTIILSVGEHDLSGQSVNRVTRFLRFNFPDLDIDVRYTRRDGDITIETRRRDATTDQVAAAG